MEAQTGNDAGRPSDRQEVVIRSKQEATEGKIHRKTETSTNGPERAQPGLMRDQSLDASLNSRRTLRGCVCVLHV